MVDKVKCSRADDCEEDCEHKTPHEPIVVRIGTRGYLHRCTTVACPLRSDGALAVCKKE